MNDILVSLWENGEHRDVVYIIFVLFLVTFWILKPDETRELLGYASAEWT